MDVVGTSAGGTRLCDIAGGAFEDPGGSDLDAHCLAKQAVTGQKQVYTKSVAGLKAFKETTDVI